MKTTSRKIISLFLSLIMVLGTVTTVLSTTVFAAETKTVTLLGVDGTTELSTGAYSVGSVIDLAQIAGIEYKNANGDFLTFVDGSGNVFGTDYTVTADATLTATYQEVKGFLSGADLAALPASRVHIHTYETSSVTKADGITYYRITTNSTLAGGVGFYLTEEEAFTTTANGVTVIDATADFVNWKIRFQMFRQLNNYDSRLDSCSYTSDFYETVTDGETTTYILNRPFTHTDYVNAGNTKVYGYRIGPWGFETISQTGTKNYDIKYVGSFDSAAIAEAFSFENYMGLTSTTVTVKGTDGETIVTLEKENGEEIDLLAETGLSYKDENGKFLTFVDSEGNVYGTDYTVIADATLTATYQEVKGFFSGADLANLPSGRLDSGSYTYSFVTKDDGLTYLRITCATASNPGGIALYFTEDEAFTTTASGVTIIDGTTDYYYPKIRFQMYRQLNSHESRLDTCIYTSDFTETITDGETTLYRTTRPLTHTDYVNAGNTKVYGYRIGPWGFEFISQVGAVYDIKYFGSFDSEAIAKVFDFDKYNTSDSSDIVTVTIKDRDENTVVFENVAPGTKITLDDILAKGDFVTQYKGDDGYYVITGFKNDTTDEEAGFTVTADETASYTAVYKTVIVYSGADMANETIGVSASAVASTGKTVVEGDDGKTYFRVYDGAETTAQHHGFCYHWDFTKGTLVDLSEYRAIRTDFVANACPSGGPRIAIRLGTREDSGSVTDYDSFSYYFSSDKVDGKNEWRGEAILDIPSTFTGTAYHMRVIPFGAATFYSSDVGYSAEIAMDHKFFGFFATSEQAEIFDYEKYLQTADLNIYFKDASGNTLAINNVTYGDKITVSDIKENLPSKFVTQSFINNKPYVISGWKTLGGTNLDLSFTATDSVILNAVYSEAIVYGAAALNEEAISVGVTSGTDYGKEFYSDLQRREYLRMFDNTTGTAHHAFKLDWNLADNVSIDTDIYTAAAVISTTNAAQASNPRQAFKLFTGKASANEGGQTSSYFNYSALQNGDEWSGLSTFELPAGLTVKGVRFMPFAAQNFANGDTGYGEAVYSDIEFIGFFTSTDAAEIFDFKAYKNYIDKETKYLSGDANADGVVNTVDAVILSRYLANWTGYADGIYDFNCDINKDGFVTPIDVIILLRRLANWTMEIPMDTERYYNPAPQPSARGGTNSFANISMSSDDIIDELYEPLRAAHPDNITRENIGKDATGTYDMWTYTFTPEEYEYTVFILGGTHGINEAQGYMGLARLMQLVWDDDERGSDKHLNSLREKVRFIVVPIVNVWDVSQYANGGARYSPNNGNNVNLNRNWLLSEPEQEVKNIKAVLAKYKDEIDFAYDFHTDPEGFPAWGSYLLIYPNGIYDFFSDRLKEVCDYLDNKNFVSKGIQIKKAFRGDDLNYPAGSHLDVNTNPNYARQNLSSSSTSVMWSEFGIPAATPEHGSCKFGDRVFCGSDDMTAAVELYANMILQQINNDFKEKIAIIKGQNN